MHGNLVRPIAVTSARRFPAFPDVPTFAELGSKDMELEIYYLLYGPAGLPADITARLNKASAAALAYADARTVRHRRNGGIERPEHARCGEECCRDGAEALHGNRRANRDQDHGLMPG